jgi:demethylmenaquinone methyltransferase/2-methoxy-6-polyprenyl-1,4-benzoquinol methylase
MSQEISRLATRQNYDRLSRWYDLFSSSEQRFTKIGLSLLNIQTAERVLEIGFGTGHALVGLAGAAGEIGRVCGIDLSPGMVAVAYRRIQHSSMGKRIFIQVADAIHLPYPEHQFQAVFMGFTLELFDTRLIPVVLAECQRVIQPGGRLGIVSLAKKDVQAVEIYEWFHVHLPNVVDCRPIFVRPVLEKAGFEVAQTVEKRLWGLPVEAVLARKP